VYYLWKDESVSVLVPSQEGVVRCIWMAAAGSDFQ